jgi:hypothetical protein
MDSPHWLTVLEALCLEGISFVGDYLFCVPNYKRITKPFDRVVDWFVISGPEGIYGPFLERSAAEEWAAKEGLV